MRELPSQGRCHTAFLLAFSATLKQLKSLDDWVEAASGRASFLASAGDIVGTAQMLVQAGLVQIDEKVSLSPQLARLSAKADRPSLVAIARLFLLKYPPGWIPAVIQDGQLLTDLIPPQHLERLIWLGPDLAPLLFEVEKTLRHEADDELRRQIGLAGERVIMASLFHAGFNPVHVSLLSDAYGYDIDYEKQGSTKRIEVKSAVPRTADRIILSRNEYDKSLLYSNDWSIFQVVFSSEIILSKKVLITDIIKIRELSSEHLHSLAPSPSDQFNWIESAEFRPHEADWKLSHLTPDASFECLLHPT